MEIYDEDDIVILSKEEYDSLIERNNFLDCLERVGVDNWSGYSEAWDLYNDLCEEED